MTPFDGDASGSFKRSTRMPLDAVVRLHFEGTVAYQNGFAANVSATGMFVKHPDPPANGTHLVFEFVIGSERKPVQGAGIVAWTRDKYSGPGRPAGIGIQFTQVDSVSRQHIAEALFEYLEASLGEELMNRAGPELGVDAEELAAAEEVVRQLDLPTPEELEAEQGRRHQARLEEPEPAPEEPTPPPPRSPEPFPAALEQPQSARDEGPRFPLAPSDTPGESLTETEEQRVERMVREALAQEEPYAGAAVARSARDGSPARWIGLAAVLVVAGAWALWHFGIVAPGDRAEPVATPIATPTPTPRPPLPGDLGPISTLAETVGASEAADAAAPPPLPAAGTAPDEAARSIPPGAADEATDPASEEAASELPLAPLEPAATATPSARAAGSPKPTPGTEPEESQTATRLDDIDWTEATGTTVVTLSGDGPFRPGSYSYFELGGDKPRVLIRLRGLDQPFRPNQLAVGTAAVAGIRNGWHVKDGVNEQHVVLDLAPAGARLDGFEVMGSRIVLKLTPR